MPAEAGPQVPAPLRGVSAVRVLVEGLDHPEGLALGLDGAIYAGGEAGQIYRVTGWRESLAGGGPAEAVQLATTAGFVLGMALDGGGHIYACDHRRHEVLRVSPAGAVSVYTSGAPGTALRTPNYPVFDAAGRLYVSDSGAWGQDDGRLFRVDPGGATQVVASAPRHFPNGLALSPDGAWLYVAESTLPGVTRLRTAGDGTLGAPEEVVRLPGTVPDGLAFDAGGTLYVSCYRPDRIYRVGPGGGIDVLADDPAGTALAAPTNVAFLGDGWMGVANLGRWHLAALPAQTPGAPLHYPILPEHVERT
jgi:gluconolactonase